MYWFKLLQLFENGKEVVQIKTEYSVCSAFVN